MLLFMAFLHFRVACINKKKIITVFHRVKKES